MNAQLKLDIPAKIAELRKLMDKQDKMHILLKPIEARIDELREELVEDFKASKTDSQTAHGLRVTKQTRSVPTINKELDDAWDQFNQYRTKKANWDLIPKSIPAVAWRERIDDKKVVPGVVPFEQVIVTVTRVDKKAKP
jgi:hypothetical protein